MKYQNPIERVMTTRRFTTLSSLVAVTAALAGCFGGGGDDPAPPVDPLAAVPAEATQTVAATVDYQKTLVANVSDTREPIDLSTVTLPTSDTTEPAAVE